ncbi:MAG: SocA family protein [Alphaproteobacteria bacterium]|nr:SocA family protein [Alphaproteobacteria bacterium]
MYNIWKILFSAEKYHLNKYGRPITGDRYIAMEYGTVPSWLYDASKIKRQGLGFYRDNNSLLAERVPVMDYFSETDLEALQHGVAEYAGLDFIAVRDKNHQEPCWKKNYAMRGDSDSAPIPFEDIIEEDWLREDLKVLSHSMVL